MPVTGIYNNTRYIERVRIYIHQNVQRPDQHDTNILNRTINYGFVFRYFCYSTQDVVENIPKHNYNK